MLRPTGPTIQRSCEGFEPCELAPTVQPRVFEDVSAGNPFPIREEE